LNNAIKYYLFSGWKLNNINMDVILHAIHDRNRLQQTKIRELMETMFSVSAMQMTDMWSLRPVVNSTVD